LIPKHLFDATKHHAETVPKLLTISCMSRDRRSQPKIFWGAKKFGEDHNVWF